jgi:hypothetical protein
MPNTDWSSISARLREKDKIDRNEYKESGSQIILNCLILDRLTVLALAEAERMAVEGKSWCSCGYKEIICPECGKEKWDEKDPEATP